MGGGSGLCPGASLALLGQLRAPEFFPVLVPHPSDPRAAGTRPFVNATPWSCLRVLLVFTEPGSLFLVNYLGPGYATKKLLVEVVLM